ncbi:MAG: DUF4238 domain-containing protein [Dehalococcoidia bacterium]|nr:DUF4238 domain-containing protein [Dehalococcoidia bacterium]
MNKEKFWSEPNLSLTSVKRQHYVPRLFLRPFATKDKIRVFDLQESKEYRTSLANIAVEKGFYDINIKDINISTENWLAKLEGSALPVIKKLLDNPKNILSFSIKEEFLMARFLVALRFRTPAFRDYNEKMSTTFLQQCKDMIRKQIYHQHSNKEADAIWNEMKEKPDHWWFKEPQPRQRAETTNFMLGEAQGFANILWGAPWRIGYTPDSMRLYTSDNPVAGYLRPIRLWGEGAAFSSFDYFVPLSPRILLRIERRPDKKDKGKNKLRGERRHKDFSEWETSFAQHVVTNDAVRYIYGEGPIVDKCSADSYLQRIAKAELEFAIEYLGYDPKAPIIGYPTLPQD